MWLVRRLASIATEYHHTSCGDSRFVYDYAVESEIERGFGASERRWWCWEGWMKMEVGVRWTENGKIFLGFWSWIDGELLKKLSVSLSLKSFIMNRVSWLRFSTNQNLEVNSNGKTIPEWGSQSKKRKVVKNFRTVEYWAGWKQKQKFAGNTRLLIFKKVDRTNFISIFETSHSHPLGE